MHRYCILIVHEDQKILYGKEKTLKKWHNGFLTIKKSDCEKMLYENMDKVERVVFKGLGNIYPQYNVIGPLK